MAADRFRFMYKFWLDMSKDDEFAIGETIEELKRARTFAKTIRDGIRLICDLRAGRLGVLFELFPWVKEAMEQQPITPLTSIEAQLARLEHLMTEQGAIPIERPLTPLTSGPKPLVVSTVTRPVFDDDDDQDTVVIKQSTSTDVGMNLINSMLGLQG